LLSIETNFFQFEAKSFGIQSRNSRLISAVKSNSEQDATIFVSNRETPIIQEYTYQTDSKNEHNLLKSGDFDLREFAALDSKNAVKYFVFDLEFDEDSLLISLVSIPQSKAGCDKFQIISTPLMDGVLDISKSKKIWNSDTCIQSFPNDPGWHDFQGRLAVSESSIYMTAGLIVASTYQGFYPNPKISGLNKELRDEIEESQLFGGVIEIDKKSGRASRFAKGFRGPSGIAVRPTLKGDEVWVADHGPRGGDELNQVSEGKDYGWPWVSYGNKYFSTPSNQKGVIDTDFGKHSGYEEPRHYWTPSIAPSQIAVLPERIDSSNSWAPGDLVLATLKAKSLFRLKIDKDGKIQSYEQVNIGARIRDLSIQGKTIYVSTDDGRIIILNNIGDSKSNGAFPAVYPLENEFYFALPGLEEFSTLVDKIIARVNLFLSR